MSERRPVPLGIASAAEAALIAGARDNRRVAGLTHNFYRYPARFSPAFARAAIEVFTKPGDYVLDPFVGGGTSLVEAMALGRHAIGVDLSQLAEFVSTVKTKPLAEGQLQNLLAWAKQLRDRIDLRRSTVHFGEYADGSYYKHLDHRSRWRLRKAIEQALDSAIRLGSPELQAFARCAILRTAQWALDGRRTLPSFGEFREALIVNAIDMISAARELRTAAALHNELPNVHILNRSTEGLHEDHRLTSLPAPKLVVTSPPYPGIHVLYHRWQVDGRKESSLPFVIANKLDGAGGSYYTMGDRKHPELATYFAKIKATMSSVAALADEETLIVQMVAFSDAGWQLDRYLEAMTGAGLHELFLTTLKGERDGRLWRSVPGRRWYSDQRGETPGSNEVVLIHRKVRSTTAREVNEAVTSRQHPLA